MLQFYDIYISYISQTWSDLLLGIADRESVQKSIVLEIIWYKILHIWNYVCNLLKMGQKS